LFSRESGAGDLTKQQFTVLAAVEQHEGVSQTELVTITGIDRSTLAEMIRRMIEKGLLDRERTEADARANSVRIGASGRKALRAARTANERVERALTSSLNAADRTRLTKMLGAIVAEAEAGERETPAAARGRRAR
jgi:DNA-binding MarR family transcriptional regulator